jgi:hypothetical protein
MMSFTWKEREEGGEELRRDQGRAVDLIFGDGKHMYIGPTRTTAGRGKKLN